MRVTSIGGLVTKPLTALELSKLKHNPLKITYRVVGYDLCVKVSRKFGKNTLYLGAAHAAKDRSPMRIAFARIPDVKVE